MGSAERRERERLEVRSKILDAARELFVAEGYDAVTMRKVAEKIEYSPTTIYLHFEDKTALIQELAAADFLALATQFQKIAKVVDPVERLVKTGRAYMEFGLSHPNHYALMFTRARPADPGGTIAAHRGDPQKDGYAFLRGVVAECIKTGRLRKDLKDVELVAQLLWAGMHGVVSLYIARAGDKWVEWRKPKEAGAAMLDVLMRGLLREEIASG
jgi:AcrR family transcriptional regulator